MKTVYYWDCESLAGGYIFKSQTNDLDNAILYLNNTGCAASEENPFGPEIEVIED